MKLYGNLMNRLEENNMLCNEITVGTGMTEYDWSDRYAYEVIEVEDQKHVTVRKYTAVHVGEPMTNNWKLVSDESNPTMKLVKRGKYWYKELVATLANLESPNEEVRLWVALNGFSPAKIRKNGCQKKYRRVNVSFGKADYYYDYEF